MRNINTEFKVACSEIEFPSKGELWWNFENKPDPKEKSWDLEAFYCVLVNLRSFF